MVSVAVHCGACNASNNSDAKFCRGCGQTLYEACAQCGEQVLLTQKFCSACGADLEKMLQKKRAEHETCLADAVAATKEYDFDRAIALLGRVAGLQDYRFEESANSAKQAVEKVKALRDQATASVNDVLAKTKIAFAEGNKADVVRLLQGVPAKLMSDDAKQILARVKSYTDEVGALESELKPAIANKNWPLVGGLIGQLLDLAPDDQQYRKLADQVAGKLMARAKAQLSKGHYAASQEQLDAVPGLARGDEYHALRTSVDDVLWLSYQFQPEPYVTPMLGRLAVRFSKEVPGDQAAGNLVKQLAAQLKQGQRRPRTHVPAWQASPESWIGGKAGLLSVPTSVDLGDHAIFKTAPSQFNVAIGLALQGLGRSRVTDDFVPKKGGLFRGLGRKKSTQCWGIDLGSAAMRAVLLEEDEDENLQVVDFYFKEFDSPLCRVGTQDSGAEMVHSAVTEFLEQKDVEEIPVWVNVSASKLVSRFVRLPPVNDKAAASLVDQEIDQKIPIEKDELAIVRWIAEVDEEGLHGRPAVITAARSHVITDRLEMLSEAGLEVAGMQADTVALINFVVHEFSDLWPGDGEGSGDDEDGVPSLEDDEQRDISKTPAVALIDCGAASTSLILVSGEAHWCWTIETGGEDFTSRLARSTKSTHQEADALLRNPAALTMPGRQYSLVEQRQEELRARLETSFADALKQNNRFDVVESWCVGGACMSHGWIRRVMLSEPG